MRRIIMLCIAIAAIAGCTPYYIVVPSASQAIPAGTVIPQYVAPPVVYYVAPPVYYYPAPMPYYGVPWPTFNFGFQYHRHGGKHRH